MGIAYISKHRTRKFVTKILRKTCSSLVKIIFGGEINLKQNKYNELQKKVFFFDKNKCKYGIIYSSITVCMQDKIHIPPKILVVHHL